MPAQSFSRELPDFQGQSLRLFWRVSSMHRTPGREWCAHLPSTSGSGSAKSCFTEYCQCTELLASNGKKQLFPRCSVYIHIHTWTCIHSHTYVHNTSTLTRVYTEIHVDLHTNPSHSLWKGKVPVPQSPEFCWMGISSPSGAVSTETSLSSQLGIQASWDSKSELHRYTLCYTEAVCLLRYNS